ncbi:MAG: alpha/beta hydrolase [Alphaproteobacteria bacterium]|nr:alpha/beta hydrolase [Alphaproteobacteria bacterium]
MSGFFPGFALSEIAVPGGTIRLRHAGAGPPLLLLHGNPQTHAMWHKVAPILAERYTVVCPDLRGYGGSFKPPASADHEAYSKRAMAADMVAVMAALGHASFAVVAHDRGARVAHRMAIDHPAAVERLAVLDIIPTIEHFERADMAFGLGYYHWFWFAQPHPFPENVISAAPEAWFRAHTSREAKDETFFNPDALADYLAAARKPDTIIGMCEDYRAAATIDLVHDRESRAAGQRIACPLLVLWGSKGKIGVWYTPLAIWRRYADGPLAGVEIASGHYLAEEAPEAVLARLDSFLEDI